MKKRQEEDYELVPQRKFKELSEELSRVEKSPFVSDPKVLEMTSLLQGVSGSLSNLLDVLSAISKETQFEETEEKIIKNQIKPLLKEVTDVKEQNKKIIGLMSNVMDRLNDIQLQVNSIKNEAIPIASMDVNTSLPPLSGGPAPIQEVSYPNPMNNFVPNQQSAQQFQSYPPMQVSQMDQSQVPPAQDFGMDLLPPPGLNPRPLDGNAIPPLEPPKKKGMVWLNGRN